MSSTETLSGWLEQEFSKDGWQTRRTRNGEELYLEHDTRRLVYMYEALKHDRMLTSLYLEWKVGKKVVRPFGVEIVQDAYGVEKVRIGVEAASRYDKELEYGFEGVRLILNNHVWEVLGKGASLTYDEAWGEDGIYALPKSDDRCLCLPLDVEATLSGWASNLADGNWGMPPLISLEKLQIEGFEWRSDAENLGRAMEFCGGRRGLVGNKVWKTVERIERGISTRFKQEA